MKLIQENSLLKKNGFYQTLEILSIKGNPIELKEFYKKLINRDSNYNAFLRIKKDMVKKGIIEIYYFHNFQNKKGRKTTKMIKLTFKGISIKRKLYAINKELMA